MGNIHLIYHIYDVGIISICRNLIAINHPIPLFIHIIRSKNLLSPTVENEYFIWNYTFSKRSKFIIKPIAIWGKNIRNIKGKNRIDNYLCSCGIGANTIKNYQRYIVSSYIKILMNGTKINRIKKAISKLPHPWIR